MNNVCCSVLISQQSLLFLSSSSVPLIVFPHYEVTVLACVSTSAAVFKDRPHKPDLNGTYPDKQ